MKKDNCSLPLPTHRDCESKVFKETGERRVPRAGEHYISNRDGKVYLCIGGMSFSDMGSRILKETDKGE